VGRIRRLIFDDPRKWVVVIIEVDKDWVWEDIDRGTLTGLSFGGWTVGPKWVGDDGYTWYILRPNELSLVDNPLVSLSNIVVMKADGSWDHIEAQLTDGGDAAMELTQEQQTAIATQAANLVVAQLSERIDKSFGTRLDGIEGAIQTLTTAAARQAEAITPARAQATPVQKSADTSGALADPKPATVVAEADPAPTVGDGSGIVPEQAISKSQLDGMLSDVFGAPQQPWWLRNVQ
jgi:hypothetical protein